MTKSEDPDDGICFGPIGSFYDEEETHQFRIVREFDGLFFEHLEKKEKATVTGKEEVCYEHVSGTTVVRPDLKKLVKILQAEIKRIKKNGN